MATPGEYCEDNRRSISGRSRVFVSYAHDSAGHKDQVLHFCDFLRRMGIDARCDRWAESTRRDWSSWAVNEIKAADFVVVVASPAYQRRSEDAGSSGGRGVRWEAAILRELVTADRDGWLPKVLPVVLPGGALADIPLFLQPHSASRYVVTDFTAQGAEDLLRILTRQPRHIAPSVGSTVSLPTSPVDGTSVAGHRPLAATAARYPGSVKMDVCRRLGDDWRELADVLGVPPYERRRFPPGREASEVWEWLEMREAIGRLRGALLRIGRDDLAQLLGDNA